jgi:biopolymer transport protein ExbD
MRLASPVPHKRARIEIIPLIDIMFFLLASFMMVSLSQTHMKGIRVNLPAAIAPPPSQVKDYVSIKIQEGNAVYFDN